MTNPIATPFTLPCGLEIKNRICKAPMTVRNGMRCDGGGRRLTRLSQECLADARTNLPNERVFRVYERWARGGLGLIVTGNVPVDRRHPEAARNVALEAQDEAHLDLYRRYADACHVDGCKVVVQLTHAGRQSAGVVNKRPLAPSAVPLEMEGVPQFMLSSPVAMTIDDIEDVKKRFVTGALLCQKAGFGGPAAIASRPRAASF